MVTISIVAPVYGVEKYIHQFLDSIEKQTLREIEVILVDDGSPDNCPQILDEFVQKDSRYKVIHQKNAGVSMARNAGLAQATGKYVYIVDSDDWLVENALEELWNEAERTNADLIYGDYYLEKEGRTELIHIFDKNFQSENVKTIKTMHCAVNNNDLSSPVKCQEFDRINHFGGAPWRTLIRKSLIDNNQLKYDPYVKGLGDDILFMLHVYEYVKKVSYIQKPIYHYRIMELSYSQGYKKNILESYELIFDRMEKYLNDYNKDKDYWNGYYFRVLIYFQQAMDRYFKNANNPKIKQECINEMRKVLLTSPYKEAIHNLPLHMVVNFKQKITVILLRLKCYKLYWMLKK